MENILDLIFRQGQHDAKIDTIESDIQELKSFKSKIIIGLVGVLVSVILFVISFVFNWSEKIITFKTVIIKNKLTKQMEQQVKEIKQ
jgi:hypothetical protein